MEQTPNEIMKCRNFYALKPGASIIQEEFGFFCLERWREERYITQDVNLQTLFRFDSSAVVGLWDLGWCEAEFFPAFSEAVLEDRGEYEVIRDSAGRNVLMFKGRRNGFMPEYLDHPVKDRKSWEALCKWRLDPSNEKRYEGWDEKLKEVRRRSDCGYHVTQHVVGGYMYLRSLIGSASLPYMFYDNPDLIHDCMETWLKLADAVIARHQSYIQIDEIFLAEDICYNHGLVISPRMVREFLFPYYRQLIEDTRRRQSESGKKLHVQIDTDGNVATAIDLYKEIGMDYMSPFEVASGSDVVSIGKKYPDLLMRGGIDKRILASGKEAIDREIDRIMPAMKARGGYIPMCDHGVPAEVEFDNYMHYRRRMLEFA
jgi:hypothetical protein